jgi:hypothetical protein
MKKGFLALGLIITCGSAVSAEPPQPPQQGDIVRLDERLGVPVSAEPPQQDPRPWAAKLFGSPANLVHDFGTVTRGTLLRHGFVMINIYGVPIEITSIRTS